MFMFWRSIVLSGKHFFGGHGAGCLVRLTRPILVLQKCTLKDFCRHAMSHPKGNNQYDCENGVYILHVLAPSTDCGRTSTLHMEATAGTNREGHRGLTRQRNLGVYCIAVR